MWQVDVTLVRFVCAMAILSPFPIIFAYLLAWWIVPLQGDTHDSSRARGGTHDASTANNKSFLTEDKSSRH